MSYRKEALESKAFQELLHAYENPDEVAEAYQKDGKKLVWIVGVDVPEEVVIAAGMVPIRLRADNYRQELPYADKFISITFGPIWRAMFDKIITLSDKGMMQYMALGNSDDMGYKMYMHINEMKRLNYARFLPRMYYVDFELYHRSYEGQERNDREVQMFIDVVETWAAENGKVKKITAGDLMRGVEVCNAFRDAYRCFDQWRSGETCRVTGSEALAVIGGALSLERERATTLLNQVALDAAKWPEVKGVRTFYTGSWQESPEVYEMIEAAGGNVVFDDHEMSARYFDRDTVVETVDPIYGIADRYLMRFPSGERSFAKPRAAAVGEVCREKKIEALFVYLNRRDEMHIWDYPEEKKVLDPMNVIHMMVDKQDYPIINKESLQLQMNEFFARKGEK